MQRRCFKFCFRKNAEQRLLQVRKGLEEATWRPAAEKIAKKITEGDCRRMPPASGEAAASRRPHFQEYQHIGIMKH